MAFRIEPRESVRQLFRRAGTELFAAIELDLTPRRGPADVHDARRCTKMLRALLQFVRSGLGPDQCASQTRRLRDFARSLGAARDAEVRLATFRTLLGELPPAQVKRLVRTEAQLDAQSAAGREDQLAALALRRTLANLRRASKRWLLLEIAGEDDDLIEHALTRSYRRARRAFRDAVAAPGVETFHDWRKNVKTLGYHLRLLRPIRPRKMKDLFEDLDALGEQLGAERDLAVLHDHLTQHAPAAARALARNIAGHRTTFTVDGIRMGERLFDEKPEHFATRLTGWWRDWQR